MTDIKDTVLEVCAKLADYDGEFNVEEVWTHDDLDHLAGGREEDLFYEVQESVKLLESEGKITLVDDPIYKIV